MAKNKRKQKHKKKGSDSFRPKFSSRFVPSPVLVLVHDLVLNRDLVLVLASFSFLALSATLHSAAAATKTPRQTLWQTSDAED